MIRTLGGELEWGPALLALVAMVGGLAACGGRRPADSLAAIRAALPQEVEGFRRGEPADLYDAQSIFSYIDGHAEVYLAYGMRRCLAQRYQAPEGDLGIVVDVFEMATPADAYGVFTHDREGDPAPVGNDGLIRHGWLSFWKGPYFVSVYAEGEGEAARMAVMELGKAVAGSIAEAGERPELVSELPRRGLDERSVSYLHDQQILNTILFLSDDNPLQLGPDTAAAAGRYHRDGDAAYLLLVDYPEDRQRAQAQAEFERRILGGSGSGPARLEDGGWYAVQGGGRRLAVVLDADSSELADSLLQDCTKAGGGGA